MRHHLLAIAAALALATHAAAQPIGTQLSCGAPGAAGLLGAGTTLFRVPIDTAVYPQALCNDGTGAIIYVRAARTTAAADKWHIHFQGGGSCIGDQHCADRWCSFGTNFGAAKMSSLFAPAVGAASDGIFSKKSRNPFRDWNHVLLHYCSSDNWTGGGVTRVASAVDPATGAAVTFDLQFNGEKIVDAVLDTLLGPAGTVTYDPDQAGPRPPVSMRSLAAATDVVVSGSSAGQHGAAHNGDRIGDAIRAVNPGLLTYNLVLDAGPGPSFATKPFAGACANQNAINPSFVCATNDHTGYFKEYQAEIARAFYGSRDDLEASCWAFHAGVDDYLCTDEVHVVLNHLQTPFFTRKDLQDSLTTPNYVASGFGTAFDYGTEVMNQLVDFSTGAWVPEEPAAYVPGFFGPQCVSHEGLAHRREYFRQKALAGGVRQRFVTVLKNWLTGGVPSQAVIPFAGIGALGPAFCP